MRQFGEDFAFDPHKSISTEPVPAPDMNAQMIADHKAWTRNTFASRAHKFCSSSLNFTNGDMTDVEMNSFNACMNKYKNAYGIFA